MKIKRDDTEESRRYWEFLEENSRVVASWPEWKRSGRPPTLPSPGNDQLVAPETIAATSEAQKKK